MTFKPEPFALASNNTIKYSNKYKGSKIDPQHFI